MSLLMFYRLVRKTSSFSNRAILWLKAYIGMVFKCQDSRQMGKMHCLSGCEQY